MNTNTLIGLVDYIVIDDKSRAVITFKFPHLAEDTHITILHDRAASGIDTYTVNAREFVLMLSSEHGEAFVINVWEKTTLVASGVYQVDSVNDTRVLQPICGCNLELEQSGRYSSEMDTLQFAMD